MHREQVVDQLWPDLALPAAVNNLHYTLHVARRLLAPDRTRAAGVLQLQHDLLTLAPPESLWVDVGAFEAAAAEALRGDDVGACRAALGLYGGELLPEDRYEDWVEERRVRLRTQRRDLLLAYAGLLEQGGDLRTAIETLTETIANEPLLEEAHVALMRLYLRAGQRRRATRQYEQLRGFVRESFGTEPDLPAQELYRDIVAGRIPDAAPTAVAVETAAPRHNLPRPLTRLIGRTTEREVVRARLLTRPLVTLTGAGGIGKTRLAQVVGWDLVDFYPDGVWLIELAPLTDETLVERALATTLGVQARPGTPLTQTLRAVLEDKRLLLILDNCEHLVDGVAQVVNSILPACGGLHVIATSREPLGLPGESLVTVPPLELPREDQSVTELVRREAVQLFAERARDRQPAFEVTEQNLSAVVQICRGLDGLPLAIELAAARTGVLSPEQIADRLANSLDVFTRGGRLASSRQRTLRGAIDWSYRLLSEDERRHFPRLAVFAGGWALEAAEVLCSDSDHGLEVLDLLSLLVDKSLVAVDLSGPGLRYTFLEPVRQYACELLEASGEGDGIRRRHAALFEALAEDAGPRLDGPEQDVWLKRLAVEHDNIRAALRWMLDRGQEEDALRLGSTIWRFWAARGHPGEGRRWLERALAAGGTAPATRMRALFAAGALARIQSDYPAARALLEECLTLARQCGQEAVTMRALATLGAVEAQQGEYMAAGAAVEESLGLARSLGDDDGTANALRSLGVIAKQQGEYERASQLYSESLRLFRRLGNTRQIATTLSNLGVVAELQSDLETARDRLDESLTLFRELGDKEGLGMALHNLGVVARRQGDYEQATSLYTESLELSREMGDRHNIAKSLITLGRLCLIEGDLPAAQAWYRQALQLCRDLGDKEVGAYCLEGLGEVLRAAGEPGPAVRVWAAAHALREATGAIQSPSGQAEFEQAVAEAGQRLGEEDFSRAWSEGHAVHIGQALAYGLQLDAVQAPATPTTSLRDRTGPTAREREVAALIAEGLTNRQIARQLDISERTVDTHITRLFRKLRVVSRAQVAVWAQTQDRE